MPSRKSATVDLLRISVVVAVVVLGGPSLSRADEKVFPGADEQTPSLAQYFSWINNTNEGSTEEQTLINLEFFKWLHDEYGMKLDIYAFDAGNIDGPGYYGRTDTEKFKKQFPNGFDPIYKKAKSFGCRLGVWLGPDGFGNMPEAEQARIDMLVGFCRDYEFALFKMDAVCGQLRREKQDAFIRLMKQCRKHSSDLILLNHRLRLGEGTQYATTFLWGGAETYIDVHMANWSRTGTHNRVRAISRGLVPELKRLTEDHGVCLSSCLDYWEDDLVLQAFNRCLILAPEIYANPWFLRDDEFPKLARIYNLHRRYRDILIKGIVLNKDRYGPNAVSRGDERTRLITLRNLTWTPVTYNIELDEAIGLKSNGVVNLREFHPTEKMLGRFQPGQKVAVEVLPFRSCLVLASTRPVEEIGIKGCEYEVVRDTPGKDAIVKLLGSPGSRATISLKSGNRRFTKAKLDGKELPRLLKGGKVKIAFPGKSMKRAWHRKLGVPQPCAVPADAEALYEATCFAANNNALEVRSLMRSGPTKIAQVKKARDAFFNQPLFTERGIWDKNLFDGDMKTHFKVRGYSPRYGGALRIDFGEPVRIDKLIIRGEDTDIFAGYDFIPASNLFSIDGKAGGLTGEYFEGYDFKKSVLKRFDTKIDFDWGGGSPHQAVSRDGFSVRWTGRVRTTEKSGIYTFVTHSDDGVRMWVDNKLIIDDWTGHPRKSNTGKINLKANTKYDIKLEYFEGGGGALVSMGWSEPGEGMVQASADLRNWVSVPLRKDKDALVVAIPAGKPVRFLRVNGIPSATAEVEGYRNSVELSRSKWRASNLFEHYTSTPAVAAWSLSFKLDEVAKGSYLAIPLSGRHGREGAYVALRVGDKLIGSPRRAPSYPANAWEYPVVKHDRNYTYFVPVTKDMVGKDIEVVVLGFDEKNLDFKPEVWITAYPILFEARELVLVE